MSQSQLCLLKHHNLSTCSESIITWNRGETRIMTTLSTIKLSTLSKSILVCSIWAKKSISFKYFMKIVFVDVSYSRAAPQPPQPLLCVALDRTRVVQHRGAFVELLEASFDQQFASQSISRWIGLKKSQSSLFYCCNTFFFIFSQ